MKIYVCSNIQWDTDGEKVEGLPTELRYPRNKLLADGIIEEDYDDDDVFDALEGIISDEIGFCHEGFESKVEEVDES